MCVFGVGVGADVDWTTMPRCTHFSRISSYGEDEIRIVYGKMNRDN